MKMTKKVALCFAAVAAFSTLPVYAQHGGGHGGGPPSGVGASMGSAHSSSAPSAHDNSANSSHTPGQSSSGGKTPSELLSQNTQLSSKLQGLLPPGTDLQAASQGFKNLGQLVAAVHVAHNLGIPFDQLKAKMIGPPSESLGKAIHELKPDADSKAEATKANNQAKKDMSDSGKQS